MALGGLLLVSVIFTGLAYYACYKRKIEKALLFLFLIFASMPIATIIPIKNGPCPKVT
jgi:hypothetical protein